MPKDYSNASMTKIVKDCTAARNSKDGYLKHPATKEIFKRLPEDLKTWYAKIMYEIGDPITLRGGLGRSDEDYFEYWRMKRDKYHPETHPDYQPPKAGRKDDDDDEGEGSAAPLRPRR